MNAFFLYIIRFALAMIIGGVTTLGAIVAPLTFATITPVETASNLMVNLFERFNHLAVFSSMAIFISEILRSNWTGGLKNILKNHKFRLLLMISLIGLTLYIAFWVTPELSTMRETLISSGVLPGKFGRIHRLSEVLYSVNFLIAMVLMFLFRGNK